MPPDGPNPVAIYAFPAIALAAVLLYFVYGAVDRLGLHSHAAEARVTDKQFARGSTTYTTEVIAGRSMVKANENPDAYVVVLDLDGQATSGMVSQQLFESLMPGERVRVQVRRTRLTKRVLVSDVTR